MGAKVEDVAKISKKLESLIASKKANDSTGLDYLNALESMSMTLDVLSKTRIGMTVNNFRKATSNNDMVSLSKKLIKSWKKLLPAGKEDNGKPEKDKKDGIPNASGDGADKPRLPAPVAAPRTFVKSASFDTSDSMRIKCREMLVNALNGEMPPGCSPDIGEIACIIEDGVYKFCKQQLDNKYKNRVRSRVSNLRDKKNPMLRENVLLGHISGEEFAAMSAEDMASSEMKEKRKNFIKESINESQMATNSGTTTDLLKCPKCGKRNCTYNQLQTRSSDEPMTTFCFCNECGKRWKFC